MKPHIKRIRDTFLGSAMGFLLGMPAWVLLSLWTGDVWRGIGIAAAVWFGITVWAIVMFEWEARPRLQRLFRARQRRAEMLKQEFEDRHSNVH